MKKRQTALRNLSKRARNEKDDLLASAGFPKRDISSAAATGSSGGSAESISRTNIHPIIHSIGTLDLNATALS